MFLFRKTIKHKIFWAFILKTITPLLPVVIAKILYFTPLLQVNDVFSKRFKYFTFEKYHVKSQC